MSESDPYSRFEYRRLIAWPERIRREWPFLERLLATAPSRRLLDLGSGTGEHARFLASHGFSVVGIDASESMIETSHEEPLTLVSSRRVELRGWRHVELVSLFGRAGFERFESFGGFDGSAYDPSESRDLLLVARTPRKEKE